MAKFNGTVENIEDNRNKVTEISENANNTEYPSSKAVKDYVEDNQPDLSNYLQKSGDNMAGDLSMNGYIIGSVRNIFMPYDEDPPTYRQDEYVGRISFNDKRYLRSNAKVTEINAQSTNNDIPSAKAVKDFVDDNKGGINYSTTEHEIGTWIDGSTLYERTYQTTISSDGTNAIDISNDNIGTIVYLETTGVNTTIVGSATGAFTDNQGIASYRLQNAIYVQSALNSAFYPMTAYVTIRYTKSS